MKHSLLRNAVLLLMSAGAVLPLSAQHLLRSANGTATELTPISSQERTAKRLKKALATDAADVADYFLVAYDQVPSAEVQAAIAKTARYVGYCRTILIYMRRKTPGVPCGTSSRRVRGA